MKGGWIIDDAVTFEVYSKHLQDFIAFARVIRSFIQPKIKPNSSE